jgi:hypothetical protein
LIGLFVLFAGLAYLLYVMLVCLAAAFLFLVQMIFEIAQALGAAAEKAIQVKESDNGKA